MKGPWIGADYTLNVSYARFGTVRDMIKTSSYEIAVTLKQVQHPGRVLCNIILGVSE